MMGYKIIPHNTLKNDNALNIVKGIHHYERYIERYNFKWIDSLLEENKKINPKQLIRKDIVKKLLEYKDSESDLFILQNNFVYEIEITNKDIEFRVLNTNRLDDIKRTYEKYIPRVRFEKIQDTKLKIDSAVDVCEMVTKEHYMFAINTKDKGLEPLKYILDLKRILKDGEKFVYQVILHSLDSEWWQYCADANKKFKDGTMPRKFELSKSTAFNLTANGLLKLGVGIYQTIEEMVYGNVQTIDLTEDSVMKFKMEKGLSQATKNKIGRCGFETSIRGLCYSNTQTRRDYILNQFKNCFACLDGDNCLMMRRVSKNKHIVDRIRNREIFGRKLNSSRMILSDEEVVCLIQLPQITLQRELNMNRLDYSTVDITNEIRDGYIPIGRVYGGKKIDIANWSRIKDILTLSKCVVGIKGSGKSKYTENYVYNAYKGGDCVVYYDYIENNLNAHEVSRCVPEEDKIILQLDKGFTFDYPEITIKQSDLVSDKREVKRMASEYAKMVQMFIDTVNIGDAQSLTSNMQNILASAACFNFIIGNTSLYGIYKILTNHVYREEVCNSVKDMNIYKEDDYRFLELDKLNEYKGKTIVDTNNKADRVLDRFNALIRDARTEEMIVGSEDGSNNINFVNLFEQNKVVLILMPEDYFSDYQLKDIVMTYFLTRMRLAGLKRAALIPDRDKRKVVHIILDEIHQLDNSCSVMIKNLAEDRKFRTTYYYTCQYLKQFRSIWDAVKGSGSHFMLLSGTEKENFEMLKTEIGNEFDIQDLISMPQYHSLNIVRGKEKAITTFISELPKELNKTK